MASVIRGSGTSSLGGDLDIEGVLTYEDVASVDSVGIITARSGLHVGTGTSISSPSSNTLTLGTNNEERFRITSAGEIGIGTASPRDPVHIFHPTNNVNLLIESGDANSYLAFKDDTTTSDTAVYLGAEGNNLKFITSAEERLRIASDGRLTSTRSTTTAYDAAATTNNSNAVILNNGAAGHATLQFQSLSGGTAQTGQATISSFNESSGSKNTALTFGTRQDSDSTVRERLRITSGGDVNVSTGHLQAQDLNIGLVANTYPIIQRAVQSSGSQSVSITGGSGYTENTTSDHTLVDAREGAMIQLGAGNPATDPYGGYIKYFAHGSTSPNSSGVGNQHVFYTRSAVDTNTERLRITSTGLVWNKASTDGSGNVDKGFYHGYSNPDTQSTGITMKCLGIGGGSGPFDTGVSVNAGNAGGVALIFATRNTSAGTATDGAVYLMQFYYNGNNTPLVVHLGGDNWVTWGQTAGNNLQASWSGISNYSFGMIMLQ